MIQISKFGWALGAFIAGALLGANMPDEVNTMKAGVRSFVSTTFQTAGRGSQEVGGFVEE